jgi:hypothetical protein
MKTEDLQLGYTREIAEPNGGFRYGAATALGYNLLESKGRKNIEQISRRLQAITTGLDIDAQISDPMNGIFHDNGNAFVEMEADSRRFFVMARSPINEKPLSETMGGQVPRIRLISGPCLFSSNSVSALAEDGSSFAITKPGTEVDAPVTSVDINPHLSVYETESIVRLSQFMSTLVNSANVESVFLNIPKVEYYNYVLDAYEKQYFSSEQVLDWFAQVDKRSERVQNLMRKRIKGRIAKSVPIMTKQPLQPIEDYLKSSIADNEVPQVFEAATYLSQGSRLWQKVLSIRQPETWYDINFLSYAVAELETAEVLHGEPIFAIAVENPTESKIYSTAKNLWKEMPHAGEMYNLVGLYPHEQVLPIDQNAERTMYHIDEPQTYGTQHARVIFNAYKEEV